MTRLIYIFNILVLGVCVAGAALVSFSLTFGAAGALLSLQFSALNFLIPLCLVLALFIRLLAYLWKENEEYGRNKLGSSSAAVTVPLLAIVVFASGYGAVSKFSAMVQPSNAKATVGSLGGLRSALSIYYGDLEGQYPEDLGELTVAGKYISSFPKVKTLDHPDSNEIVSMPSLSGLDTGGWGYVNNPYDQHYGNIFIDCTHTDPRGKVWTAY